MPSSRRTVLTRWQRPKSRRKTEGGRRKRRDLGMTEFSMAEDGLDAATSVSHASAGDSAQLPSAFRLPSSAFRLLSTATAQLRAAGVEFPRLDAELLLAHVLQVGRPYLLAHSEDVLPASA